MRAGVLTIAAAALAAGSPVTRDIDATSGAIVDVGYVKYSGSVNKTTGVTSWQGIRFAAPPTGELRWQPPVDIEKSNNYTKGQVINATAMGPICLQQAPGWATAGLSSFYDMPNLVTSEDCLLLNVRKPNKPASSKLPVIVQIHGGGYDLGYASAPSGEDLVSSSKGEIIYVETQYRLGGLGFLNAAELKQCGTANAGLLDQRAALNWVQRHIAAFGGDPSKVTIIGGSAGGGAVSAQMQLFGGDPKPPFRAAVAEFPWWQNFHTPKTYEQQYASLLKNAQCSDITCLRQLSFDKLRTALNQTLRNDYTKGLYGYGDFYWGPGVDGSIIKEFPSVAFSSGHFSKVPMIVDHDALEGLLFTNSSLKSRQEVRSDLEQVWPLGNKSLFDNIERLYPIADFNSTAFYQSAIIAQTAPNQPVGMLLDQFDPGYAQVYGKDPYVYQRSQIFGDAFISCGTRTMAASLVKQQTPVWKLIYNSGVLIHGAVDYSLLTPNQFPGTNMTQSAQLQAYFISFATDLDPNKNAAFQGVARPIWQGYGQGANILQVNYTNVGNNVDEDKSPRCDFFFQNGNIITN